MAERGTNPEVLSARAPAPQLLKRFGLRPKKSFGQNFLESDLLLGRIAEAVGHRAGDRVIELGAGLGALTHHLLQSGAEVVAVERDRDLAAVLRELYGAQPHFELHEANAATLDYASLAGEPAQPLFVCGNLPYHLAARLMVDLCGTQANISGGAFLVQREVGERIVAQSGHRDFGLLAALIQRRFAASLAFSVPRKTFVPPPRVDSVVVALRAQGTRAGSVSWALYARAAKAVFSQPRKTLRNVLSTALGLKAPQVEKTLASIGIAADRRAQTLSIDEIEALAEALFLHR